MNVNMRPSATNHAAPQGGPSAATTPADPRSVPLSSPQVGATVAAATPAKGAQPHDRAPLVAAPNAKRPKAERPDADRFTDRLKHMVWLLVRPFATSQHPLPATRRILGHVLVTGAQVALVGSGLAMLIMGVGVVPAAIAGAACLVLIGAAVVISVRYARSRLHAAPSTDEAARRE